MPQSTVKLLVSLMERLNNEEQTSFRFACAAINAKRAVFWYTCTWQDNSASLLLDEANIGSDIVAFLKLRHLPSQPNYKFEHGLDKLIPLNRKAVRVLLQAYSKFGKHYGNSDLAKRRTARAVIKDRQRTIVYGD